MAAADASTERFEALRARLSVRRIKGLDGLRGVSLMVVAATHLKLVPGHVSLIYFFMLSGFLITWLLLEEEKRYAKASVWRFYGRRVLRVFPLYYLALLAVVFVFPPTTGPLTDSHVTSAYFYYSNYYQSLHGTTHGSISHYWSLAVEEQYYLIWPVMFAYLGRWRAHALVVAILAVWARRIYVTWWLGDLNWAYHAFDCRADHILVGTLAAVWIHAGVGARVWDRMLTPRFGRWSLIMIIALSFVGAEIGKPFRFGVGFSIESVLVLISFLCVIVRVDTSGYRWLQSRFLIYLGDRSYAVYLVHMFVLDRMWFYDPEMPGLLQFLCVMVIGTLIAEVLYQLVERPVWRIRGHLQLARHD